MTKAIFKKKKGVKRAGQKKTPLKKATAHALFSATDSIDDTLRELGGTPITSFAVAFNPSTNTGVVRFFLQGGSSKDLNNLNAANFAAIVQLLSLSNTSFNGQYLLGSK